MNKPEQLKDLEIENISVDTWLKNEKPFATNIAAYTAISRAIEAEVNKRWEAMLAKQEPVGEACVLANGEVIAWLGKANADFREQRLKFGDVIYPFYAAPQPVQQDHTPLLRQALEEAMK